MRAVFTAVAISFALSTTVPAGAALDDDEYRSWRSDVRFCGRIYQSFVANRVEYLVPNFLETMLANARWDGANEEDIKKLAEVFYDGRRIAYDRGWTKENYGEPDERLITGYRESALRWKEKCRQEEPKTLD